MQSEGNTRSDHAAKGPYLRPTATTTSEAPPGNAAQPHRRILSEKDSASRRSRDDESDDTPRAIFDSVNQTRGSPTREPKPATIESRFTQIDSTRRKSDRDKQPATATHAEE